MREPDISLAICPRTRQPALRLAACPFRDQSLARTPVNLLRPGISSRCPRFTRRRADRPQPLITPEYCLPAGNREFLAARLRT